MTWQQLGTITEGIVRKLNKQKHETIHDRQTADLPINSVVVTDIVDDPYSKIGEVLSVTRSIRDDPVAGMYSRSQIDTAQFMAARRWQRYHEQSTIGPISAIDPTKEAVDGGKLREAITDHQLKAFRELYWAHQEIGKTATKLLLDILGERMTIFKAAQLRGAASVREVNHTGRDFRTALETLAIYWGLAAPKSTGKFNDVLRAVR